jgi:hypothetical protein
MRTRTKHFIEREDGKMQETERSRDCFSKRKRNKKIETTTPKEKT